MKAVTVAGGSSDDPKIEAETTVLEGEPEATADADAGVAGTDRAEPEATDSDEPAGTTTKGAPAEPEADPRTAPKGHTAAEPRPGAEDEAEPEIAARPEKDDEPQGESVSRAEPKEQAATTPA
ncbi:hypothetical protein ACFY7Y_03025, partial [Streptomyces virginiae]